MSPIKGKEIQYVEEAEYSQFYDTKGKRITGLVSEKRQTSGLDYQLLFGK